MTWKINSNGHPHRKFIKSFHSSNYQSANHVMPRGRSRSRRINTNGYVSPGLVAAGVAGASAAYRAYSNRRSPSIPMDYSPLTLSRGRTSSTWRRNYSPLTYRASSLAASGSGTGRRSVSSRMTRINMGRYHPEGYNHGRMAGTFPKAKKLTKKYRKKQKIPSLVKSTNQFNEAQSLTAETNCTYMSYSSLNRDAAVVDLGRSIVRALFWKLGYSISDFANVPVGFAGATLFGLFYMYQAPNNGQFTRVSTAYFTTASTFDTMATALITSLLSTGGSGTSSSAEERLISHFGIEQQSTTGGTNTVEIQKIYGDTSWVHLKQFHKVRIQNYSGAAATEEERDSVPLVGKVYTGKGLVPYMAGQDNQGYAFMVSPTSSILAIKFAGNDQQFKQALPAASIANCKAEANFKIENGEIKSFAIASSHRFKLSESLAWLMSKLSDQVKAGLNPSKIGHYKMFAFEKAIGSTEVIRLKTEIDSFGSTWITGGHTPAISLPQITIT